MTAIFSLLCFFFLQEAAHSVGAGVWRGGCVPAREFTLWADVSCMFCFVLLCISVYIFRLGGGEAQIRRFSNNHVSFQTFALNGCT